MAKQVAIDGLVFTPEDDCDNCDGTGYFETPDGDDPGTPCHFCLSNAIRRGELDGLADNVEFKGGLPVSM